ncbi:hypothetical protein [Helicobacter sp. 23-1045]
MKRFRFCDLAKDSANRTKITESSKKNQKTQNLPSLRHCEAV